MNRNPIRRGESALSAPADTFDGSTFLLRTGVCFSIPLIFKFLINSFSAFLPLFAICAISLPKIYSVQLCFWPPCPSPQLLLHPPTPGSGHESPWLVYHFSMGSSYSLAVLWATGSQREVSHRFSGCCRPHRIFRRYYARCSLWSRGLLFCNKSSYTNYGKFKQQPEGI